MRFGEFIVTIIALICVAVFMSEYQMETIIIAFIIGLITLCSLIVLIVLTVKLFVAFISKK